MVGMEQTPRTSFIPKQSVGVAQTRQRRSLNVFAVISMIGLLSVLTLSCGLFFYQQYASRKLETQKQGLADFKDRFDSSAADDIREIKLLEDRFGLARDLLDKHLAVSELFYALEDRVQKNAQIKSFTFERETSGVARVALEGEALSFNTVALQKREFVDESVFKDDTVTFSDINTSESETGGERVTFAVAASVATDQIAYVGEVTAATSTATSTTATTTIQAISEPAPTE